MNKLLHFLEFFKSDREKYSVANEVSMDPYRYSEEIEKFIDLLYSESFIMAGFDWPSWQEEAVKYFEDKSLIESADLETICKLLTTFIRKDRFSSGTVAELIDQDVFLHILKRLDQLQSDFEKR
jgi:hypothetical protein